MPVLTTTATNFQAGTTAVAGTGEDTTLTFSNTWVAGDEWTLLLIDTATGEQIQVGAGNATGIQPSYSYTFQQKVYILAGATTYFSATAEPTVFNDPNQTSAGFVTMSDFFDTPAPLIAVASYQGRLAFFSRSNIQIYSVTANPAQWQQNQIMTNIGTFAKESVKSYGDLDVYFLSDTGVRSLRVLDNTLNATIDDIGSPIDSIIQAQLATLTPTQQSTATAFVDPTSRRYCLSVTNAAGNGAVIYCLSYYRSSKVAAWSTFQTTYNNAGTQAAFVPQNWVIFNGRAYTRDSGGLYIYGLAGALYDNCVATIISPYMDMKKPADIKENTSIDVVAFGDPNNASSTWAVSVSTDPISGTFATVLLDTKQINPTNPSIQSTTDATTMPFSDRFTHLAFKAVSSGTGFAKFSEFICKDNDLGTQP